MKDCKKIIEIIKNLLDNLSQLLLPPIKKKKKTVHSTNHDHFKIFVNQYFWPIHILVQSKRLKRYFLYMLMAYWQAEQSKAKQSEHIMAVSIFHQFSLIGGRTPCHSNKR